MPSSGWVRRDLDVEIISKMYLEEKMSAQEIAKAMGTSSQTIGRLLEDIKIRKRNIREANLASWAKREYPGVEISERQEQIIVGTLLGDGHLGVQVSSRNPTFSVGHREVDKEYTLWKYSELESTNLFRNPPFPREKTLNRKIFRRWGIRSIQHPILKTYFDLIYQDHRKTLTLETLEKCGALGVAIYYMDDGGLYSRKYPCFYTYGYREDEILLLRYFLSKRWDLHFELKKVDYGRPKKKGHILIIEKESIGRFRELIVPHIIPCMSRKIPP